MTEATTAATGEAVPSHEIELRLRWRQTWPDREAHYTAFALTMGGPIGCIYLVEAGVDQGAWAWAITADDYEVSRNCGPMNGVERSARHAAKHVEEAWFSAIRPPVTSRLCYPLCKALKAAMSFRASSSCLVHSCLSSGSTVAMFRVFLGMRLPVA